MSNRMSNQKEVQKSAIQKTIRDSVPYRLELSRQQIDGLKTAAAVTLALVGVAGVVVLSVVAPNVIGVVGKFALRRGRRLTAKESSRKAAKTFYYLRRSGLITIKEAGGSWKIFLTDKGKRRLKELDWMTAKIPKPKKWDGKWWQVAADIPTKEFRRGADLLRAKLKEMDFYPLQRTLWFYPYDPREALKFIVQTYHIEQFVTVMEINRMDKEDEDNLKSFFRKKSIT